MMRTNLLAAATLLTGLACGGAARAQYVGPINPSYPPQPGGYLPQPGGYLPQPGGYVPQPGGYTPPNYYPPAPGGGGFVTGNPSPAYDPNAVVGGGGNSSMYWDPARGWVTNTQNTTVLNSATSMGRGPAPGQQIQNYNYWNGSQWVQGSRWLGQDGLWHGDNTNTTVTPNGSTSSSTTYYSVNPNAGGARPANRPPQQYGMPQPGGYAPQNYYRPR